MAGVSSLQRAGVEAGNIRGDIASGAKAPWPQLKPVITKDAGTMNTIFKKQAQSA